MEYTYAWSLLEQDSRCEILMAPNDKGCDLMWRKWIWYFQIFQKRLFYILLFTFFVNLNWVIYQSQSTKASSYFCFYSRRKYWSTGTQSFDSVPFMTSHQLKILRTTVVHKFIATLEFERTIIFLFIKI